MRKTGIVTAFVLLLVYGVALIPGCGGAAPEGGEEGVVSYAIEVILVPEERESSFIVEWRRKPSGPADVSPEKLALRFWKWEGGALTETSREEYDELAGTRDEGNPNMWTYSRHSVTVLELDEAGGEAVVEIGSLYGPLSGSGTRYRLRRENGEWKRVSEQVVWAS